MSRPNDRIDAADVQGIVLWGYGGRPLARYFLLRFDPDSAPAVRTWLNGLTVQDATPPRQDVEVLSNVAFTARAIEKLDPGLVEHLPPEFDEGMATERRARLFQDVGSSHPACWSWGDVEPWWDRGACGGGDGAQDVSGPGYESPVDILLLVYGPYGAGSEETFDRYCEQLRRDLESIFEVDELSAHALLPEGARLSKEHFGFTDGIGEPRIRGWSRHNLGPTPAEGAVRAGEFLIGYPDEEGPGFELHTPYDEFFRNGSYLVFRQLEQDVAAFWSFIRGQVPPGDDAVENRVTLASKMVGRWPNGAPLALARDLESAAFFDAASRSEKDAFSYAPTDADGFGCPFGAHLRRANPRDSVVALNPDEARRLIDRRRLIRRGRPYGPALHPDGLSVPDLECVMALSDEDFQAMRESDPAAGQRGIHFICFNAEIRRQFEFVQHSWINDPSFGGLDNDPDPVVGPANDGMEDRDQACFTIPRPTVRTRITGMTRFVKVVGGGYFFLPGLSALETLAAGPIPQAERVTPSP